MSLQDTVLAMTVMVSEAARLGSDAIVDELVASGLTPEEAQTAVNDVIYVKLGPAYRKAKVQQLHDAGMTQRQIAAEIGVSHTTIQRDLGTDVPAGEPDRAQNGTPFGTDVPGEVWDKPALTPSEAKGPTFERTFRYTLRNLRTEYGEFASKKKYAALFAAIDKALENQ